LFRFDPDGGFLKLRLAVIALFTFVGCGGGNDSPAAPAGYTGPPGPASLETEDIIVGTGAVAAVGDQVSVNYVGMFLTGVQFDSSAGRGPLTFVVGAGSLIPGFEQGVVGMRVGGKRRVTMPPSLAYGTQGRGSIPPNAPLRFEIDLLSITGK
jgi:FKBP-type peptidyl-prolyl cis-trans isomerase FkpA